MDALKAGRYYSTQGPALRQLLVEGERLYVETSEAYAITLTGSGDRWMSGTDRTSQSGEEILQAEFDLSPFEVSYCRIIVVDRLGHRAWSNPIWPWKMNFREFPLCEVRGRSRGSEDFAHEGS